MTLLHHSDNHVELTSSRPAIGPLLGAAVTQTVGWRWTSWLILFFTIALVIIPAPFYRESYKPVLLRQRARKNGDPLPPSPLEGYSWAKALKIYVSKTLTRPMQMLLTEPIVAAFNTYSAFNFGLLYGSSTSLIHPFYPDTNDQTVKQTNATPLQPSSQPSPKSTPHTTPSRVSQQA